MVGIKVGADIYLNESKIERSEQERERMGGINLDSSSINGSVFFQGTAVDGDVRMVRADVGGDVYVITSGFTGKLHLPSASIGGDLIIRVSLLGQESDFAYLSVGRNLSVEGAKLSGLDATGARIGGSFRLRHWENENEDERIEWIEGTQAPVLKLNNVRVRDLQTIEGAWPNELGWSLGGFVYSALDGFTDNELIRWLNGDEVYLPQSYRQVSSVLRDSGRDDLADDVLFAMRERERSQPDLSFLHWFYLSALRIFIGYGYGGRMFWSVGWVAGLSVIGTIVLYVSRERIPGRRPVHFLDSYFYSLDMLLPVVHLRELHYTSWHLMTWSKYYFYGHKLMGYVLIFFVIAGLSGLSE